MASVLAVKFGIQIVGSLSEARDLGVSPGAPINIRQALEFANGAAAGQVDRFWADTRQVAASDDEDIDLAASLTDPLGQAFAPARIKALYVRAHPGNTNNVVVTQPADVGVPLFVAAGGGIVLKPGGVFLWVDPSAGGVVVTADTGDILNIANSGAGTVVDYDIAIAAASA